MSADKERVKNYSVGIYTLRHKGTLIFHRFPMDISGLKFRYEAPIFNNVSEPKKMIIAIDFDGTIVTDEYPEIGTLNPGAVEVIKKLKSEGYQLILWTCRTGLHLAKAVKFCAENGIRFDAINSNLRSEVVRYNGSDPRKVGAIVYIDDRGIAPLPDWDEIYRLIHKKCPTETDLFDIEFGYRPE